LEQQSFKMLEGADVTLDWNIVADLDNRCRQ
jgi:hypothetical protein